MYKTYHLANAAEQDMWRARPDNAPRVFYSMYYENLTGFTADCKPVFVTHVSSINAAAAAEDGTVVQWSIVTHCNACNCDNCDDCVCDMPPLGII
jgi:hypothetical protein